MRLVKKVLCVALSLTMLFGLTACGNSSSSSATTAGTATAAGDQLKIGFFMFENSNTFTTYIRKGLESYGLEKNVVIESFDGKSDQSTQTDAITTALAKNEYDIIVVNPVDSGAGTTINNLCKQAGVPVIYCDRAPDLIGGVLDEYENAYYVGLDWSDPGKVQAEMVYEDWKADMAAMDKNGDGVLQYVIIQGNVAQQNAIYRCAAIDELMTQWNTDGTMKNERLDIQDGNWSSDKGKDIMDVWNVKYGDQIEAVLCNNDTMAMGAIESLKTAGAFDTGNGPAVYGINAIPDVWEALEDGFMAGTVMTSTYKEATAVIDIALNIKAGKDALDGTGLQWGEFGKDIRVSDVPIRIENIQEAKDDYGKCM